MVRRDTGRRAVENPEEPILLPVPRFQQPDDVTCGPTCLTQVFRYFGLDVELSDVIRSTRRNPDGGTLAVFLGQKALDHGFRPTLYSFNYRVFDPTWSRLSSKDLGEKLRRRRQYVESRKLARAIEDYEQFIARGGGVHLGDFTRELLLRPLRRGRPILTGLSATYLYRDPRELPNNQCDDVRGDPVGHFVVICGYYPRGDRFVLRDPASHIPFSRSGKYSVPASRLIPAILLGDVTYDANLLTFGPRRATR